ncbi:type III secretion system stalk subunit SctO [Acidovorax sp.]|uniref:type III secretion system stalk subunit SctO n=1 Tax=Acidovorax sp. TaxID=1872122 RepID=UPI003CFCEA2C
MSIFRDLLAIKAFREGQAESAVRVQRQALADAQAAREAAQALFARLMQEGLEIETALYRDLCARIVRLREIEDVQLSVAGLRQREAAQQDAVDAAQRAQEAQTHKLDTARAAHKEASRQKSKFVDLARNYADAQLREVERKEDLEMEEAASVRRDREDWDAHDPETTA